MMVQRRNLFLAGIVAAILVPVALMEAAESANNKLERGKPATSKTDEQPAAKTQQDESSRSKRPLTATQGTPVLGVIIGKRIGIEAAEVERVWPGSPAEQAGLRAGDRITRVDDEEIKSPEALRVAVLGREPGDHVRLTVLRDGEQHKLKALLGGADGLAGWSRKDTLSETPKAPGWLGVRLAPGLSATQPGVIVTRVFSGSPADAAGGHFNPGKTAHGGPQDKEHHAGDLGNIEANKDGVAQVDITAPWLKLHFVIGRSIIVHAGEDDLESQPSGDAGPRVAMGVIGIAEPLSQQRARASDPK